MVDFEAERRRLEEKSQQRQKKKGTRV